MHRGVFHDIGMPIGYNNYGHYVPKTQLIAITDVENECDAKIYAGLLRLARLDQD